MSSLSLKGNYFTNTLLVHVNTVAFIEAKESLISPIPTENNTTKFMEPRARNVLMAKF